MIDAGLIAEKYCPKCKTTKNINSFSKSEISGDYKVYCDDCCTASKLPNGSSLANQKYHADMKNEWFVKMQRARRMERYYRQKKDEYKGLFFASRKDDFQTGMEAH